MMKPYGFLVHSTTTIANVMSSLVLRTGPILLMIKEMLSRVISVGIFLRLNHIASCYLPHQACYQTTCSSRSFSVYQHTQLA